MDLEPLLMPAATIAAALIARMPAPIQAKDVTIALQVAVTALEQLQLEALYESKSQSAG